MVSLLRAATVALLTLAAAAVAVAMLVVFQAGDAAGAVTAGTIAAVALAVALVFVLIAAALDRRRARLDALGRVIPFVPPEPVALDGTARAIPSRAQEPGVAVLDGFQATCRLEGADHWPSGERLPNRLGPVTWVGPWHAIWINAALDAIEHNHAHHRSETL